MLNEWSDREGGGRKSRLAVLGRCAVAALVGIGAIVLVVQVAMRLIAALS